MFAFKKLRFPEVNPVLIYELRQLFRSRWALDLFGIYLAFLVFFFIGGLAFKDNWVIAHLLSHGIFYNNLGFQLAFGVLCSFYAFTTVLLVLHASFRMARDRLLEDTALETSLSAWRITAGKFQFGLLVGLLFVSLAFPFLTAAYLVKGVDLRMLVAGTVWFFGFSQLHYWLTIAFLAGAKTIPQGVSRCLPMLLLNFLLAFFWYLFLVINVLQDDLPEISPGLGITLPMVLFPLLGGILFLLSAIQFSPEQTNRMRPVRIVLTVFLLLQSLLTVLLAQGTGAPGGSLLLAWSWGYFWICLLALPFWLPCLVIVFICERDEIPARWRETLPTTFGRRCLAFPFCTGAACAMAWCLAALAVKLATIGLVTLGHTLRPLPDFQAVNRILWGDFSFFLLVFNYALTTLLLYNLLLKNRISRQWVWLPLGFAACVLGLLAFVDLFFHLPSFRLVLYHLWSSPLVPRPWNQIGRLASEGLVHRQLLLGVPWLGCLLLPTFYWIARRFQEFKPTPLPDDRVNADLAQTH